MVCVPGYGSFMSTDSLSGLFDLRGSEAMSSTLTVTYLTLFWMIFLVWVSYIMFYEFNLNLNLGWALSAMAFRVLARNFYKECVAFINEKKKSDES